VVCLNLSGGEFSLCEGNIPKEDALQGRASGPAVIHRSEEVPRKHTILILFPGYNLILDYASVPNLIASKKCLLCLDCFLMEEFAKGNEVLE
jgi:hypothetical protein